MSTNIQQYSLFYFRAGGALLAEEGEAQLRRSGNGQIIKTVLKGFAGVSPGAPMCEGFCLSFVPASGLEFDAGSYIVTNTPFEMGLRNSAGQEATIQGVIMDDEFAHGTDRPASYRFAFVGVFPQFQ